jgi:hypothetical protein
MKENLYSLGEELLVKDHNSRVFQYRGEIMRVYLYKEGYSPYSEFHYGKVKPRTTQMFSGEADCYKADFYTKRDDEVVRVARAIYTPTCTYSFVHKETGEIPYFRRLPSLSIDLYGVDDAIFHTTYDPKGEEWQDPIS